MLACLGDVRSGPKIPLQMVHTNIEQENFRCSWCWNGAAFHRWLNLHQVNWIHSFWIHHCTSGMFPSIGCGSMPSNYTLSTGMEEPNISFSVLSHVAKIWENPRIDIYIYIISFAECTQEEILVVFWFSPLPICLKKQNQSRWDPRRNGSKRRSTFGQRRRKVSKVWKWHYESLRECQSLVIQQRGGELWRVWELMCLASLGNRLKTLLQDNYVVRICIYVWIRVGVYEDICKHM